jgi:hypothetical protein
MLPVTVIVSEPETGLSAYHDSKALVAPTLRFKRLKLSPLLSETPVMVSVVLLRTMRTIRARLGAEPITCPSVKTEFTPEVAVTKSKVTAQPRSAVTVTVGLTVTVEEAVAVGLMVGEAVGEAVGL